MSICVAIENTLHSDEIPQLVFLIFDRGVKGDALYRLEVESRARNFFVEVCIFNHVLMQEPVGGQRPTVALSKELTRNRLVGAYFVRWLVSVNRSRDMCKGTVGIRVKQQKMTLEPSCVMCHEEIF